jgi:enoyl-CoA hydratase/carnithine racemase
MVPCTPVQVVSRVPVNPRSRVSAASDAVRWFLLTAEEFGASEALRIGLVQEVVPAGQQLARAVAIVCAVTAAVASQDAAEGLRSFVERRAGRITGR